MRQLKNTPQLKEPKNYVSIFGNIIYLCDNKETLVIATHGFVKKVDKVPAKEIDRAVRLKDKYFNNKLKK